MFIKSIAAAIIAALLSVGTPAPAQTAAVPSEPAQTAPAAAAALTEGEAAAAALEHAGLTEGEVTQLRTRMDRDDRRSHWEVSWRSGDWAYDYDIDPETGAVVDWERDYEPVKTAPAPTEAPAPAETPPPTEAPAPTQPKQEAQEYLSREKARSIALAHAGFTADQVTGLRAEFDRDDGVPVYEVDFRVGRIEYEYEIHAETGAVLSFDKDD